MSTPRLDVQSRAGRVDAIINAGAATRAVYDPAIPDEVLVEQARKTAAEDGVEIEFVLELDDDGGTYCVLKLPTGRGTAEMRPAEGQSWEDLLEELGLRGR